MNTSKQVNVMIGLMFLAAVTFGAYIAWEPTRSGEAVDGQAELFSERGAEIYVNNCRGCHGMEGDGHIAPALDGNAFLIVGDDHPSGVEPTGDGEADGIRSFLHNTLSCGRTGTFMPLWSIDQGGALSRIQIDYLVELITTQRWDLVEEYGFHHDLEINASGVDSGIFDRLHDGAISAEEATAEFVALGVPDAGVYAAHEEHLLSDEQLNEIFATQTLVKSSDIGSLALTTSNCGQYNAATLSEFRTRDPLVAAPPPGDGPDPTPTATPGGGDHPSEDAVIQGQPIRAFFAERCAVCHGQAREGGVGLPLTRDVLTEPDELYIDTIANGRGAVMPAWSDQGLSDQEIADLVTWLKNTDP